MIQTLKLLQLIVSIGAIVLLWLIYPRSIAMMGSAVGLCYVLASLGALRDFRPAIWLAFAFSMLTLLLSGYGVYRYFVNGFDFLAGRFAYRTSFYGEPYVFLLVALGSAFVVAMHVYSWRWTFGGPRA